MRCFVVVLQAEAAPPPFPTHLPRRRRTGALGKHKIAAESGCTTGFNDNPPAPPGPPIPPYVPPFPTPKGAKNVLFLPVDDMRPSLGLYNFSLAHTPNLDKLAYSKLGLTLTDSSARRGMRDVRCATNRGPNRGPHTAHSLLGAGS